MQYSTYHIHVCQLFCHNVVLKRGEFFWIVDLQVLSINQVTGGSATEPIWQDGKHLSVNLYSKQWIKAAVYFATPLYYSRMAQGPCLM